MATASVNGVHLQYELLGDGPSVVLTSSGWADMEDSRALAETLASDFRVLIYDRCGCGASDIDYETPLSEWHQAAEDLHELIHHVGMAPAYAGGASSGCAISLLITSLQPGNIFKTSGDKRF